MECALADLINNINNTLPECVSGDCAASTCREQPCKNLTKELSLLSSVLKAKQSTEGCEGDSQKFATLTSTILRKRIKSEFMRGSRHSHVHALLSFLRIAFKEKLVVDQCKALIDHDFINQFIRWHIAHIRTLSCFLWKVFMFSSLGDSFSQLYFDSAFQSQKMFDRLLVEVLAVLSRIIRTDQLRNSVLDCSSNLGEIIALCASVLPCNKTSVLQLVFVEAFSLNFKFH